MSVLPQTAAGRIALMIALSLLVHAILLFAPMVHLQPHEPPLPPLIAKLEPLPDVTPPAPPPKPKPKPKVKPKPAPPPIPEVIAVPDAAINPASAPPETLAASETLPESEPEPIPEPLPPAEPPEIQVASKPAHPLPKHAELTYMAYKGTDFAIGKVQHRLEISDDHHYTLKVSMNTIGLASIFISYEANQQSSGTLTPQGLQPDEFREIKQTSKGKETLEAHFNWAKKMLSFANGQETPLPDQAQDIISFLYQLSQLPLNQSIVPIYISNGKKLERYELSIGEDEFVQTQLGKLRTLPLHKVHAPGEEGLDIWLGLEYRLLPVKVRQIARDGSTAGELRILEIRVADE